MAKQPTRLQNIISILNGGFNFAKILPTPTPAAALAANPRVMSDTERDRLLQLSVQSDTPRVQNVVGQAGFLLHAQRLLRSIAHDKIENDRILDMAPEVSQAASIMVPSILSPNDLRSSAITITSTCKEVTPENNGAIGEILTEFFEDELQLSTVLPQWIHEALYRAGAKPLLILPLLTLRNELTHGPHVVASQEAFNAQIKQLDQESWYGIADTTTSIKTAADSVIAATEALTETTLSGMFDALDDTSKLDSAPKKDKVKTAYRKLVTEVLAQEALTVIDNPSSIQFSQTSTTKTRNKITKTTKLRYKESTLIVIDKPEDPEKQIDNPIFMPLPSESVIPVYTPGAPNDHIGYFVMLTEYGHPVEITPDMANAEDQAHHYTSNQTTFNQLFQAYGMTDFMQGDQRTQDAMTNIYQNIVESHLRERLSGAGFGNIGIGRANNIYRYMFARYLQQRRTKLLFVPKDLLTYFCFKYNEYGAGESKLNELKFILALRISLIVCRMLVAFNNAIDRKKIDITFDQGFTGNVIEHMRTVQREAMRKSSVSFSSDPMAVSQQVATKSYAVKAHGIPGLPDYEVTNEPNQKNDAAPDDQLAEDLKNLLILKLEVPAAAMNNLGEAEYSRSVVTTNLFFSRATLAKQKIVTTHLDDMVQTYTTYSNFLQKKILAVIKSKHNDGVTPEGTTNEVDSELLTKIIKGIHSTLPPPNVAPDKSQFDALDGILSSIDGILNAVLSDEIANGDTDLGAVLTNLRGLAKSQMVAKYIKDFGFADMDIPTIEELDNEAIIKFRQSLMNISKGLKQQAALIDPGATTTDTGFAPTPDDMAGGVPDDTLGGGGSATGDAGNPFPNDGTDDSGTGEPNTSF